MDGYWQRFVQWSRVEIVCSGKGTYTLPNLDSVQKGRIIGLAMRKPGSGKKGISGAALINANAFNCGFLTLKSTATNSFLEDLPFEVLAIRDGGDNFFFRIDHEKVDINSSKFVFSDKTTEVAGEVVELLIAYLPEQYCNY